MDRYVAQSLHTPANRRCLMRMSAPVMVDGFIVSYVVDVEQLLKLRARVLQRCNGGALLMLVEAALATSRPIRTLHWEHAGEFKLTRMPTRGVRTMSATLAHKSATQNRPSAIARG